MPGGLWECSLGQVASSLIKEGEGAGCVLETRADTNLQVRLLVCLQGAELVLLLCVRREVVETEAEKEGQSSLSKAWNGKSVMVLPTCQPYSQEDTIGYLYFFSGIS